MADPEPLTTMLLRIVVRNTQHVGHPMDHRHLAAGIEHQAHFHP